MTARSTSGEWNGRVLIAEGDSCRTWPDSDFAATVVVRSISMLPGEHAVYNLRIDGLPEFVANGVLVHNCEAWPAGKWKDQVDASSGAFNRLATSTEYITDYRKWV